MQNYMKTVLSAFKNWTDNKIKDNKKQLDDRITNSTADWSQNDKSADNYVKNRTHWEETVENVILHEQTLEGFGLMEEPLYVVVNAFYIEPELNQTYTITWDGVRYDAQCQEADGLYYLGNENYVFMEGGGDIPFAIIFSGDIFVVTESTETSHTISITTSETVVHKIDEKYLPKLASTPDWNQNDPDGEGYIKNRPFYEVVDWIPYAEEQAITLNYSGGTTPVTTADDNLWPHYGQDFKVVFDGEEYRGTVWEDSDVTYRFDFTTNSGVKVYVYDRLYLRAESAELDGDHTIAIYLVDRVVTPIPKRYLPDTVAYDDDVNQKMDKSNPTGTGSLSMNRKSGTTIGSYSHAEGYNTTASGSYSHAEGYNTTAQGRSQHVSGEYNILSGTYVQEKTEQTSNVGIDSTSSGVTVYFGSDYSFDVETGTYTLCGYTGSNPSNAILNQTYYFIFGGQSGSTMYYAAKKGFASTGTYVVFYKGAIKYTRRLAHSTTGGYLTIVGNGTSDTARSNAHTLDWYGNGWYAGKLKVGGIGQDDESAKNVILEGETLTLENVLNKVGVDNNTAEYELCYGDNKFVGVMANNIVYSINGFDWKVVTGLDIDANGKIAYGNGKFVYAASNGTYTSIDAINWKKVASYNNRNVYKIIYADNKFVITSRLGVSYSADGNVWKSANVPTEVSELCGISYGNGVFVATVNGADSNIAIYSTDGVNWETTSMPSSQYWYNTAYGNGKFVAMTIGDINGSSIMAYSDDGINWVSQTNSRLQYISDVIYANNMFIGFGGTDVPVYSLDGLNWQYANGVSALKTIAGGNERFVGLYDNASYGAVSAYSDDGINWTQYHEEFFQDNENVTDTIHDTLLKYSDPSLSNANHFADAKAVGDAIRASKPHFTLTDTVTSYEYIIRMQNGSLTSTCKASSIAVTTQPTKTSYTVGETLDLTDMIVTLTRQDGATEEINNYSYTEPDMSAAGTVNVELSYVEAGETYTTILTLTVVEATTTEETTE